MTVWWAVGLYIPSFLVAIDRLSRLIGSTALIAVNGQFLVNSISGMVQGSGISQPFLIIILLPVVANTPDVYVLHLTEKLTLTLSTFRRWQDLQREK